MAKTKNVFFCSNCGNESPKWQGKCPGCGEWNTFVEEIVSKTTSKNTYSSSLQTKEKPKKLHEITISEEKIGRAHV